MQTDKVPSAMPADETVKSVTPSTMSDEALARRRMLLRGLGKGTAAVAVVVPIQTLAAVSLVTGGTKLCTVSGVQSNVGSGRTDGGGTNTCQGYAPSYYSALPNWPRTAGGTPFDPVNAVDGITFTRKTAFHVVFGATTNGGLGLFKILNTMPDSDLAVWITALLNALANPPGFNFPYSPSEVRAFYFDADPAKRANALFFFRTYMQQVLA